MERISCDIVRDLMPGYMDEICSEDSKKVVEEHLEGCTSCRAFLEQVKQKDDGREALQVDGLRKVRRVLNFRMMLCFTVCAIVLVLMGEMGKRTYGAIPQSFFLISLPVLMITYYLAFSEGRKWNRPRGSEWFLPVVLLFALGAAIALQIYAGMTLWRGDLAPEQAMKIGPCMHGITSAIAICAGVLVVLLAYLAKQHDRMFLISQNLSWLTLHLTLSFGSALKNLNSLEEIKSILLTNGGTLALEFVCVLAGEIIFHQIKARKSNQ